MVTWVDLKQSWENDKPSHLFFISCFEFVEEDICVSAFQRLDYSGGSSVF